MREHPSLAPPQLMELYRRKPHWRSEGELEQKFQLHPRQPVEAPALPRPLCAGLAQRQKLAHGWREASFARLRQAGTPVPLFPVLLIRPALRRAIDDRGNELMAVQDLKE